jgi:hypothetical protein
MTSFVIQWQRNPLASPIRTSKRLHHLLQSTQIVLASRLAVKFMPSASPLATRTKLLASPLFVTYNEQ